MSYADFQMKLDEATAIDGDFCVRLLNTVINNPQRYVGIFRLSNPKTKLIQNVTQSREIKFGDFMESIVTEYIERLGFKNLDKRIGVDDNGDALNVDQLFIKDKTVFLVEQKMRDDHDSTKKRGQYLNFQKKCLLIIKRFPGYKLKAAMWFIDDSMKKNFRFYTQEMRNDNTDDIELNLFYGAEFFHEYLNSPEGWAEICSHLEKNKAGRGEELLYIPDFDTSEEMCHALISLKENEPKSFNKLISNKVEFINLRKELFPTGENLRRSQE